MELSETLSFLPGGDGICADANALHACGCARPFGNELADSQCARISKLRIRAAKPGSLCGWCSLCFRLASRTKHDPMGVRYGAAHIIAFVCIACRKGWVGDDADISGLDSPPTLSLSLSSATTRAAHRFVSLSNGWHSNRRLQHQPERSEVGSYRSVSGMSPAATAHRSCPAKNPPGK